jgi:hypothetical protein
MSASARGTRVNPWFGVLLALLTVEVLSPSVARAGCSAHYVKYRSQPGDSTATPERLDLAGVLPPSQEEAPRERPAPCSGALCSGNPATPFSSIPPVTPPGFGQWAIPAFAVALADPGAFPYPPVEANLRPVDHSCSVFHPPRARARFIIP